MMEQQDRWAQIAANPPRRLDQGALLPESGWGALIAWLAGPDWVHPLTSSEASTADGRSVSGVTSADDQRIVDESVADFLTAASVPPAPPGALWVLHLPPGTTPDRLWEEIHRRMAEECPQAQHPLQTRACLERVLPSVLAGH